MAKIGRLMKKVGEFHAKTALDSLSRNSRITAVYFFPAPPFDVTLREKDFISN